MKTEHDSFLAFYLTEDNESALKFKETRFDLSPYEVPENEEVSTTFIYMKCTLTRRQETTFHFMRDYETVKVEQEVPNEFLLVLYDGDPPEAIDDPLEDKSSHREKGAFYKNIERKMHLKKKRANVKIKFPLAFIDWSEVFFRYMNNTRINGR